MTKEKIREYMVKRIQDTLEEYVDEHSVTDLIGTEEIDDFLYVRDYGHDLVADIVTEYMEEMVEGVLESIYESITEDDLSIPF